MRNVIIAIAALLLIGTGVVVLTKKSKTSAPANNSTTTNSSANNNSGSSTNTANSQNVITYDGSSFSPANITVKSGSTVTIKNTSGQALQFDSDPHPIHTDDTDLNIGIVEAGQSVSFTVTQKGTFGYHNHLDSSQRGTITIE